MEFKQKKKKKLKISTNLPYLLQGLLPQSAPLFQLLRCRCSSSASDLLLLQTAGRNLGFLVLLLPLDLQQPSLPQCTVGFILLTQQQQLRTTH